MAANIIAGFFILPFLVHSLGDENYGLWTLANVIISFYGLLDIGLNNASQRYITRAIADSDKNSVHIAFSTSFFLFLLLSLCSILITIILITISPYFISNTNTLTAFQMCIALLGFKFVIALPISSYNGLLYAKHRFDIISYIQLFVLILRTALIFILISTSPDVVTLASLTVCAEIVGLFLTFYFSKRTYKDVELSRKHVSIHKLKNYFEYSKHVFISTAADRARVSLVTVIIGAFMSLSAITLFTIANTLADYFARVMNSLFGVFGPSFTIYHKNENWQALRDKFYVTSEITALAAFYLGGLMIVLGEPFIAVWMGKGYEEASTILIILALAEIIGNTLRPAVTILYATANHSYYAKVTVLQAILALLLAYYLIEPYGLTGVAFSLLISLITFKSWFLPKYTCNVIDFDIKLYYQIIGKILIYTLIIYLPGYYLISLLQLTSIFTVILAGLILSALYLSLAGKYVLSDKTNEHLLRLFPDRISKIYAKIFI